MDARFTCVIPKADLLAAIEMLVKDFIDDWTLEDAERLGACSRMIQQVQHMKFNEHLEKASQKVSQWPAWKKSILGGNNES
jgi:hypothetical protein